MFPVHEPMHVGHNKLWVQSCTLSLIKLTYCSYYEMNLKITFTDILMERHVLCICIWNNDTCKNIMKRNENSHLQGCHTVQTGRIFFQTACCHIPEEWHCHENVKFCVVKIFGHITSMIFARSDFSWHLVIVWKVLLFYDVDDHPGLCGC